MNTLNQEQPLIQTPEIKQVQLALPEVRVEVPTFQHVKGVCPFKLVYKIADRNNSSLPKSGWAPESRQRPDSKHWLWLTSSLFSRSSLTAFSPAAFGDNLKSHTFPSISNISTSLSHNPSQTRLRHTPGQLHCVALFGNHAWHSFK